MTPCEVFCADFDTTGCGTSFAAVANFFSSRSML